MCFAPTVKIPLQDAPQWVSHLELSRNGDEITISVVKHNGLSYGHAKLSDVDFNNVCDLILTRSSMERTI